ncbi:hypothetical protein [Prescottella agglutinans]|uniref:Phage-related minor tail protein n=1 Tax=Prescottella agglutinans TaxID=1644129 RepID=A0ABT6MFZ0_9NOCA|nr:hypothetical protein [Prescottella agglutinans]MDH6283232.1 phage-related minor tail protein [Prescottella agglutinans]
MASNAVELAVGYITIIPEMRGVPSAINQVLGQAQNQGNQAGQGMGNNMSGGLKKAMLAGAAGVGLAVGAVLGKALSSAMENEVATDKLAAGLGLNPADAAKAGKVAGQIYAQAYGESMGDVTTAVDAVFSSLSKSGGVNFDDGSLDKATKKAMDLAKVYDVDVAESAQMVNQLLGQGLVKNVDEGFDMITASFQRVPAAMRGEIPDIANEYGTYFRSIGFSGQEMFGTIVNASNQGKIAMDKVGDAVKEFGIRATDLGDTGAVEAIQTIGLGTADIQNRLLAGGESAKKATQEVVNGLLAIKDPAKQAELSVALFGTPLEDLDKAQIPGFLTGLADAGKAMDGFGGSADQLGTTLNDNLSHKIEAFKRTVTQGLTNFVSNVILPGLGNIYDGVAAVFGPAFQAVKDSVAIFIGAFTGNGADVEVPWMNTIIDIASRARGIFDEIKGGFTAMVSAFKDGGDEVTSSGFAGFLESLGVTARNLYDAFNSTILPVLQTIGGVIRDVGEAVIPILVGAFGSILDIVGTVGGKITDLIGWFNQHKDVVLAVAGVITATMLPALISMGVTLAGQALTWGIVTAAVTAYNVISKIVAGATKVWAAGQWLLNAALNANPISLIILAIAALVAGIVLAYRNSETFRNIVQTVWDAIKTAISFAWESVIKPVFEALKTGLQAVGDFFIWVWDSLIKPAWEGLGAGIDWVWQNVIRPAWDGLKAGLQAVGDFFSWVWNSLIKPAWDGLGAGIDWVWQNIIKRVWDALKTDLQLLGDFFKWIWESLIKPAWDALGYGIQWVIDNIVLKAFDGLKNGLQAVKDFFGNVVDGIKNIWDGLRSILAKPINFLIETVWNNGILKAWNVVAEFLPGIDPAAPLAKIPEHATGGAIRGPGSGKSDDVLMWGSNGEHMLTAAEVLKAGGHNAVYAIRDMIARGIPFSWNNGQIISDLGRDNLDRYGNEVQRKGLGKVDPQGMFDQLLPAYKDGGPIEPWQEQLMNGHRAAKMRNGNPYTWGFEDCSGYMSAIADAIINGGDGKWSWATGSFPGGQPWVPGLGEGFSVGVHDNPGGPGGGHTAGTLSAVGPYSAVNVESGGAHGYVAYGGPAVGADDPQWNGVSPGVFHLGIGANGFFQSGGPGRVGPSPEQQRGFIEDKIHDTFNTIVSPIRDGIVSAIGAPPPKYLGVPPEFLDHGVDVTSEFLGGVVGGLGDALSSTWQSAKNLVGGLFDNGGVLPDKGIGVNLSGKPEAVLTNDQWKLFAAFNDTLAKIDPELMGKLLEAAPKAIQTLDGVLTTYSDSMGDIKADAPLEILGLKGSLLDPDHRYNKAIRDYNQASEKLRAEELKAADPNVTNVDNSVNINNPILADVEELVRLIKVEQKVQSAAYSR